MMMNQSSWTLFVTLTAALVALVASYSIPYDGKNLHLNSHYRLGQKAFEKQHAKDNVVVVEKEPTPKEQDKKSQYDYPHHGGINFHLSPEDKIRHFDFYNRAAAGGGGAPPINAPTTVAETTNAASVGESHKEELSQESLANQQTKEENAPYKSMISMDQHDEKQEGWKDAFFMFAVWSLDNLFWLIPFAAHSSGHVFCFFNTYQFLVLLGCFLGTPDGTRTFTDAHWKNVMWGAAGALVCWIYSYYYYKEYQSQERQERKHRLSNTATELTTPRVARQQQQRQQPLEENDLETPLLESTITASPCRPSRVRDNNTADFYFSTTSPTAWLTISLTLLGCSDDIFFVPVMVRQQTVPMDELFLGSLLALSVWTSIALCVSRRFQASLVRIPLHVILCVYAAVMTGHSGYNFVVSSSGEIKTYWHAFLNLLKLHL